MARRRRVLTVDALVRDIDRQLEQFHREIGGLTLRQKVLQLVSIRHAVSDLGVTVAVDHNLSRTSARERIRVYFFENAGTPIDGEELAVVSGILDYARRVRELRVEQGFRIFTGASADENSGVILKPDQYQLISVEPDLDAARRWAVANRIRRGPGGSQAKVLEFLRENVGRIVTTEDLAYVAKNAREFARRARELRTEEGYALATRFTGRPDLGMGEYILITLDRIAEPHDRHIPLEIQRAVYERDDNTCRICGWNLARWSQADPRILELHHVNPHARRGQNVAANLIVICSKCHDRVHAGQITIGD